MKIRAHHLLTALWWCVVEGSPVQVQEPAKSCKQTKVAILGAGMAGIAAGSALHNASIDDFIIVEYNSDVGGRVAHTSFGKKPNGGSYTVELGANWVQGTVTEGGPENPIWTFAKKYKLQNTYSNYSSIQTFTDKGAVDFSGLLSVYEGDIYSTLEQDAGYILTQNLQDHSYRTGLSIAGWHATDAMRKAVEWWEFDWEYAFSPDQSSHEFAIVNYNTSFYQWSEDNNYVFDPRGYSAFIKGVASMYLKQNDPRLLLNKHVANVAYDNSGVIVYNSDGSCIQADYAITTFSLGVMQNATANSADPTFVKFTPKLPDWKRVALQTMQMATYTKIFLQFPADKVFWDKNTQFFLYADPATRGYYPLFQSLDGPGFLPGSGIFFCTVVQDQAATVAAQTDEETKQQVLAVLRNMYGASKVPEPIAFLMPRWAQTEWAKGSYSNWPPGLTLEMHQNIRANVGALWFAGEHTHPEYYGFLQGAWYEGQRVANDIAALVKGKANASQETHYNVLHGTTNLSEYADRNGWEVSSFLTYGDV